MAMPEHVCPYGLKAKWLLEKHGIEFEDHTFSNRSEVDAFKEKYDVATTPQIFLEGERIGGYSELREHFGEAQTKGKSYRPVLRIFAVSLLLALAMSIEAGNLGLRTVQLFAAFAMVTLALQKLVDIESFSTMFLNYDLLAKRVVPYAYVYPYAEAAAGVLMIAGDWFAVVGAPVALFIGSVGAASVFWAVYVQKRELKCACVGGNSEVPLGAISLTENLVMIMMGLWMLLF